MNQLKNDVIKWIKDWFEVNGDKTTPAVIGISGGKDSSVVAALCVEALGKDRVIGVIMPCGKQHDIEDSYSLVNHLGIKSVQVNIGPIFDATMDMIQNSTDPIKNELVKGNTQARLRMTTLYAISQEHGGRVSNNCNASERFVGYFTLYGDDSGDFAPISSLPSNVVMELGQSLGLPSFLAKKIPIDGLENNHNDGEYLTDEDVMGFTYKQLNEYMNNNEVKEDKVAEKKIRELHHRSEFKRKLPRIPHFQYKQ